MTVSTVGLVVAAHPLFVVKRRCGDIRPSLQPKIPPLSDASDLARARYVYARRCSARLPTEHGSALGLRHAPESSAGA